jgi:hypothetical protein
MKRLRYLDRDGGLQRKREWAKDPKVGVKFGFKIIIHILKIKLSTRKTQAKHFSLANVTNLKHFVHFRKNILPKFYQKLIAV